MADVERVELVDYQQKSVARTWFNRLMDGITDGAPHLSWVWSKKSSWGGSLPTSKTIS